MMNPHILVAIDGPAGAGKSSVARGVSKKLNLVYVDTGAMYRAIAWKTLRDGINIDDVEALSNIIASTCISMDSEELYLDGFRLTEEIRTPEVATRASQIAKVSEVRRFLVQKQQEIAKSRSVVMDGRDIGTHVLPGADVKIFLTASIDQRALRRYEELKEKGIEIKLEDLKEEIRVRDEADSTRRFAPLKQARDAILIDTTDQSIHEVIEIIYKYCIRKLRQKNSFSS